MTEQPNSPEPPSLGMWKTVGQIVQFHLWKAHGEFTQAIMRLEARNGKYTEQLEALKKLKKEVKEIIEEIGKE